MGINGKEFDFEDMEKDSAKEGKMSDKLNEDDVILTQDEYKLLVEKAGNSDKNYDLFLRSQADLENFRKRVVREKQDLIKYAADDLIYQLLNVVDDFNRGLLAAEQSKDFDLLLKGVNMIQSHLMTVLTQRGLEKIECVGKKFNPETQEVLNEIESDQHEDLTVVEELQAGYILNGKVVRTAKVTVSRNKKQVNGSDIEEEISD